MSTETDNQLEAMLASGVPETDPRVKAYRRRQEAEQDAVKRAKAVSKSLRKDK